MKRILTVFVLISLISLSGEESNPTVANNPDHIALKEIAQMRAYLTSHTIAQFVTHLDESNAQIPPMRSNWYVQKLGSNPDQQSFEQARRDFGFELVKKLNDSAAVARAPETKATTLEEEADSLLKLRDDLIKSPGYENLFLARRSVDIAAVATIRLIADLDYPLKKAEALAGRFTDDWDSTQLRMQALNAETEDKPFGPSSIDQEGQLRKTWGENISTALEHERKGTLNQAPQLAFYIDDEPQRLKGGITTESLWNYKMHFLLAQGLDLQIRRLSLSAKSEQDIWFDAEDFAEINELGV